MCLRIQLCYNFRIEIDSFFLTCLVVFNHMVRYSSYLVFDIVLRMIDLLVIGPHLLHLEHCGVNAVEIVYFSNFVSGNIPCNYRIRWCLYQIVGIANLLSLNKQVATLVLVRQVVGPISVGQPDTMLSSLTGFTG